MNKMESVRNSWQWLQYLQNLCFCLVPLVCLLLAACGGGGGGSRPMSPHVSRGIALECAPFARALTGVSLRGAAASWWQQADGLYVRTQSPHVGSILVLRSTGRMPNGHVAVVSEIVSPRRILVTHANWMPHRIGEDQPVEDVSAAGDWSDVRVWWPPSGQLGLERYRAFGFIHPDHPVDRTMIAAAIPPAIRTVADRK